MKLFIKIGIIISIGIMLFGCFPKMAKTPKMGAEYQFEKMQKGELKKEEPRRLFNKDMEEYLQERGEHSSYSREKEITLPAQDSLSASRSDSLKNGHPTDSLLKKQG